MNDGINITLQQLLELQPLASSISLSPQHQLRSQLLGGHLSNMRGRGMEFTEVRNYQGGDDIRHMDWRITAKTGKPHIKLYREERERPIFLVIDFNPSMFFGTRVAFKTVIAAQVAGILAWAAAAQGDRVGGLLFAAHQHLELKPQARRRGVLPLLHALSDFSYLPSQHTTGSNIINNMAEVCLKLRAVAKPGAMIIICSDFNNLNINDANILQHLRQLTVHQQLVACYIRDPLEIMPPPPATYAISDAVNTMLLDLHQHKLRLQYQQYFAQLYQTRLAILHQAQIPVLNITTTDNLLHKLQQFFTPAATGVPYG